MVSVTLPRLVGTREAVGDLLSEQQVPSELDGQDVEVRARLLTAGSTSFADELVDEVLVQRRAARLSLLGAPDTFAHHLLESARRRGVDARVSVESTPVPGLTA